MASTSRNESNTIQYDFSQIVLLTSSESFPVYMISEVICHEHTGYVSTMPLVWGVKVENSKKLSPHRNESFGMSIFK